MKIGYFLSSEEWGPQDLVAQAVKAQEAGFEGLWISDHYHPWNDEQGHSPFVWSTIGAGYCTVGPEADSVKLFRSESQNGQMVQGGLKVCWDADEEKARKTVHRLWANEGLPGELAQVLPTPEHFEQASELVTEDMLAEDTPCGPDVEKHVEAIKAYEQAGFDELYINQIGPEQDAFFEAYREHVLPRVR